MGEMKGKSKISHSCCFKCFSSEVPQAFRWRFHIWLYELPPMRKRISRILQARVYVFSIKCVTPIDKPNLRGYNIPAVCTAGISGGVGNGTNGNPKEDPRSWEKEFLEKGFKDASLNQIVAEAGFTKGAFYGYYPDKTALFEDLVGGTASELLTRFKAAQDDYFDLVPEGRAKDSLALSTQHLHELVAFMYDHFDEFKLILCRAEGTGYADFIEVLVELEVDRSEEYYALLRKTVCSPGA